MHTHEVATIEETQFNGFTWVDVRSVGENELEQLRERFGFLREDLERCLPPIQRPHLYRRGEYELIVLVVPVFDRTERMMRRVEVDFFVTKEALVTIHPSALHSIERHFFACALDMSRPECTAENPRELACAVLRSMFSELTPMLTHVANDIDDIRTSMFTDTSRGAIEKILRVHTNVATLRGSMHGAGHILEKFDPSLGALVAELREHGDAVELYHQTISAIHESYSSFVTSRTGEIMKTLTLFAVVVYPLTLLVTIFDSSLPGNPFVRLHGAFWFVIALLLFGTAGMVLLYKKKRWL